jgi:FkbM family methyltransferase
MRSIQTFWKPYVYETLLNVFPQILVWREAKFFEKKMVEIMACEDNARIPRHADAGKIVGGTQVMHNGLRVLLDCYSAATSKGLMADLLTKNKGVHEPAEEFAFQVLLNTMPESATIVELGSFWAFYSMWFCSKVKKPKAYLIEPDPSHLDVGKKHFEMNGFKGEFFNYFVGRTSGYWTETKRSVWRGNYAVKTNQRTICIDDFVAQNGIPFIDILHSDIQGAELDMLKGAEKTITERKVRYFCVSTHGDQLHRDCVEHLRSKDYVILCEADPSSAMHIDGYIVARAREMPGPDSISVHKKTPTFS